MFSLYLFLRGRGSGKKIKQQDHQYKVSDVSLEEILTISLINRIKRTKPRNGIP